MPRLVCVLDFEVQRCTRRCAATDRPLAAGEVYYSVLIANGAAVVRHDYSAAAWQGPPEGAIGWWQARMPTDSGSRPRLAPAEVALELFDRWVDDPEHQDAAYVLALFLVRKRVFRFADRVPDYSSPDATDDSKNLLLFCPRRAVELTVPVVELTAERTDEIQQQFLQLLYSDAA